LPVPPLAAAALLPFVVFLPPDVVVLAIALSFRRCDLLQVTLVRCYEVRIKRILSAKAG
jgi:hypothetical protein